MNGTFPQVGFRAGRNCYALLCPTCKAEGEIGVLPEKTGLISCPNKCGAMFLQRRPRSLFAKPVLEHALGWKRRAHNL